MDFEIFINNSGWKIISIGEVQITIIDDGIIPEKKFINVYITNNDKLMIKQ